MSGKREIKCLRLCALTDEVCGMADQRERNMTSARRRSFENSLRVRLPIKFCVSFGRQCPLNMHNLDTSIANTVFLTVVFSGNTWFYQNIVNGQ